MNLWVSLLITTGPHLSEIPHLPRVIKFLACHHPRVLSAHLGLPWARIPLGQYRKNDPTFFHPCLALNPHFLCYIRSWARLSPLLPRIKSLESSPWYCSSPSVRITFFDTMEQIPLGWVPCTCEAKGRPSRGVCVLYGEVHLWKASGTQWLQTK